ncbi:hypothetical protein P3T76_013701 [Phytophthora citrophthora]|uniref:Uncharacterized protein n=1 Tax=Phytophthora citrophthora TaxID=4793 RepID=A0AAD9LCV9_9STRA|nr:hypothetical protein P3T76_013701 [Phytophthora citrophthora]
MIRHRKEEVLTTVPEPVRYSVEVMFYNLIVESVQVNLAITDIDPKTPGSRHPDSLLYIKNKQSANTVVTNVALASTGGFFGDWVLPPRHAISTVEILDKKFCYPSPN